MIFDWTEYYALVEASTQDLLTQFGNHGKPIPVLKMQDAARLRSCISRVYYSAFCSTRNYLRDELGYSEMSGFGKNQEKINLHREIPKILGRENSRKLRKIGLNLKTLRDYRNKADYEDTFPGLIKETKYCLNLAKNIILILSELQT
ncbi:MAG: DNA-binding protein [Cyanobacteria bacterium J06607_15]